MYHCTINEILFCLHYVFTAIKVSSLLTSMKDKLLMQFLQQTLKESVCWHFLSQSQRAFNVCFIGKPNRAHILQASFYVTSKKHH